MYPISIHPHFIKLLLLNFLWFFFVSSNKNYVKTILYSLWIFANWTNWQTSAGEWSLSCDSALYRFFSPSHLVSMLKLLLLCIRVLGPRIRSIISFCAAFSYINEHRPWTWGEETWNLVLHRNAKNMTHFLGKIVMLNLRWYSGRTSTRSKQKKKIISASSDERQRTKYMDALLPLACGFFSDSIIHAQCSPIRTPCEKNQIKQKIVRTNTN